MAVFLVGKTEVVKDGFEQALCAYLWSSTSSNNTSQVLSWQTGGLWREIMSWEVHDMLLKSLWLDLENQMALQGKEIILESSHMNIFEPQSRYLWVVFVSNPGSDRYVARKPLCTADPKAWNIHDVTFFLLICLALHRGTLLALWCFSLILPHVVCNSSQNKVSRRFHSHWIAQGVPGSMTWGDQVEIKSIMNKKISRKKRHWSGGTWGLPGVQNFQFFNLKFDALVCLEICSVFLAYVMEESTLFHSGWWTRETSLNYKGEF